MSTNELLLLGLLGRQRMHGYELHEFLERRLGFISDLKKPTAYRLLDALHEQGLVERDVERHGRRPERQVYRLTAEGRERFLALLREELARPAYPIDPGNTSLLFSDQLPATERASLLARRREALDEWRRFLAGSLEHHSPGTTVRLIVEHDLAHLDAEAEWLATAADRLADVAEPGDERPEQQGDHS